MALQSLWMDANNLGNVAFAVFFEQLYPVRSSDRFMQLVDGKGQTQDGLHSKKQMFCLWAFSPHVYRSSTSGFKLREDPGQNLSKALN